MRVFSKPIIPGIVAFALAACSARDAGLLGEWEGDAGEGRLRLDFRRDGTALMQVKGGGRNSDYYCTWSVAEDKVHLVHPSGQTVEFRIMSVSDDRLDLQVGRGSDDTCELHRTGAAPAPVNP